MLVLLLWRYEPRAEASDAAKAAFGAAFLGIGAGLVALPAEQLYLAARACLGRLSGLRVSHSESVMHGAFV